MRLSPRNVTDLHKRVITITPRLTLPVSNEMATIWTPEVTPESLKGRSKHFETLNERFVTFCDDFSLFAL